LGDPGEEHIPLKLLFGRGLRGGPEGRQGKKQAQELQLILHGAMG
jgi:hypothetical protein